MIAAAGGLLLTSPLLLAAGVAVRLSSPGPILYRGRRVGIGGAPFEMLKFRTMVVGADRRGPAVTLGGDDRVTSVGRILRRTKLDELPQLWNVLRGDMALVGPRPEHPDYVALYTPEQRRVLSVRPGVTGAGSVAYRHEEGHLQGPDAELRYREVLLPAKLALELDYLERRSLLLDLRLVLATVAPGASGLDLSGGRPAAPPPPPR